MAGTSIVRRPPFGNNPQVGERGTDTQRRILDAALEVFGEAGFNEARVELITERAGCSRPAFYQYFSNKDDVFWALAGELGREMVELGDQLEPITPDAGGVAALARWIDEFTTLYETYSPVFSAFQAASRNHEPMARGSRSISDQLGDALTRSLGAAGHHSDDPTLATAVVAILVRCSFYWEVMTGTVSRPQLVDGLAQLLHRLFAGPIPGVNITRGNVDGGEHRSAPRPVAPSNGAAGLRSRGEQTRQRLLDAGALVLPERGYHDARVDDIVEAAGVSHGSFYRYFDNKDEFFRVLAADASSAMIELIDAFPWGAGEEELRAWLRRWFTTYESNGGVISTWQEMQERGSELVDFSQEVAASVLARLMALLDRRGFGDPLVDSLALIALIERMPYSVFTLGFTDRDHAIAAMVAIWQRAFMALTPSDG